MIINQDTNTHQLLMLAIFYIRTNGLLRMCMHSLAFLSKSILVDIFAYKQSQCKMVQFLYSGCIISVENDNKYELWIFHRIVSWYYFDWEENIVWFQMKNSITSGKLLYMRAFYMMHHFTLNLFESWLALKTKSTPKVFKRKGQIFWGFLYTEDIWVRDQMLIYEKRRFSFHFLIFI